jgi:hypothetical protein
MSRLYETVRIAVHRDWDPIGIAEFCQEMGEYDSYVPCLCELIDNHATERELFDYLWTVETVSMGLSGDRQATERFAKWLCELGSSKSEQDPAEYPGQDSNL